MRIAVCDDEEIFRADIQKHIDKLYSSLDVVVDSRILSQRLSHVLMIWYFWI